MYQIDIIHLFLARESLLLPLVLCIVVVKTIFPPSIVYYNCVALEVIYIRFGIMSDELEYTKVLISSCYYFGIYHIAYIPR